MSGQEDLPSLLDTISNSSEFNDVQLRVDERKTLNQLNGKKTKSAIRFPLPGRVTSRQMKVNW
jgi:ATP-dependent DNA helicase HFM1/MER3